jgi:hypothetical protein
MPNREFAKQRFCLEAQNPETAKPFPNFANSPTEELLFLY